MIIQMTRLVILIALCVLLNAPADAQDEVVVENSPTDFLPLQVGNQWIYKHVYDNYTFGLSNDWDPGAALRRTFEIPGYPFDGEDRPPKDLTHYLSRELTIEITHTETIEGHEYFVFSEPEYNWPPVPNFFLAGQKVRFSDEGVLLYRQQEQDIPLYDLSKDYIEKHDTIPEYPLLYDEKDLVEVNIRRTFRDATSNWFQTPARLGQAFIALFQVFYLYPVDLNYVYHIDLGHVYFITGYGIALYDLSIPGAGWSPLFWNILEPISAVINGEEIAFPFLIERTNVQPASWGKVKVRHGRGQ